MSILKRTNKDDRFLTELLKLDDTVLERINYLRSCVGTERTLEQILASDLGNVDTNNAAKGNAGKLVELFILGKMGDNLKQPDLGKIELKAVSLNAKGNFKENLRLSIINYDSIQQEDFAVSALRSKCLMLVVLLSHHKTVDKTIKDIGFIDLEEYSNEDYEAIRTRVKNGIELKSTKDGGRYIIPYSSGTHSSKARKAKGLPALTYKDSSGIERPRKGMGFYLKKQVIGKLFQSIKSTDILTNQSINKRLNIK